MIETTVVECLICSGRTDVALVWAPALFAAAWARARQDLGTRTVSGPVLARACGNTPDTIFNWRKGVGEPSASQVMALARVLRVSPFTFFRAEPVENESGGPPAREAATVSAPADEAGR